VDALKHVKSHNEVAIQLLRKLAFYDQAWLMHLKSAAQNELQHLIRVFDDYSLRCFTADLYAQLAEFDQNHQLLSEVVSLMEHADSQ
jgi:hypothetical protein